jgi:hypothetical protein
MGGFTLESLLLEVLDKLDPKQFSLPKKLTTQALVYLMHQIHAGLDKGQCSARVFFQILKSYVIIRWIKSFLTDREQCVRVGNCKSSWKKTNGGYHKELN